MAATGATTEKCYPPPRFGVKALMADTFTNLHTLRQYENPFLIVSRFVSNIRSEEHTSELQSPCNLVCRHLLAKKIRGFQLSPALFRQYRRTLHGEESIEGSNSLRFSQPLKGLSASA